MIFLAVGTQLPFDRLTRALDAWCAQSGRGTEVFGQIGEVGPDNFRPTSFQWEPQLAPADFDARMQSADVIVAHAGMGCIITALYLCKPIVIMARRANLGEQRNDHQIATAKRFAARPGVHVVEDGAGLSRVLEGLQKGQDTAPQTAVSRFADDRLIGAVRAFIHDR